MNYDYNKDEIKESLDISQIEDILMEFGAEPQRNDEVIVSKTICHNHAGEGSHKLYYYANSRLFHCYTGCEIPTFDIYELVRKVMSREQPKNREDSEWNLPEAIDWVARRFGFSPNIYQDDEDLSIKEELKLFDKYERINNIDLKTQEVQLKEYDGYFLKNLPRPRLLDWEEEGISREAMLTHDICYDPVNQGIVIPHYDINNRLVGIRERALIQEIAERYGKYRPAKIGGKMYNHPLSYNLYNLNMSKDNIKRMRKAVVFESEKSCLKYASYFGAENDISVAICGSSFIQYQAWMLINLGVEEIIVGLDHDFTDLNSEEAKRIIGKLKNIFKKYGMYVNISFLWDKHNILGYKSSPIDHGPEKFLQLFKERINLY